MNTSGCTLTVYKSKKSKNVYVLSSNHKNVTIDEAHKKKIPENVRDYNKSKAGVDVLDQMARYHTCKTGTRRWPVAFFFNIIYCACLNAYIVYKEVLKTNISRRDFLLKLVEELCKPLKDEPSVGDQKQQENISTKRSRKRKHCQTDGCSNKTYDMCVDWSLLWISFGIEKYCCEMFGM